MRQSLLLLGMTQHGKVIFLILSSSKSELLKKEQFQLTLSLKRSLLVNLYQQAQAKQHITFPNGSIMNSLGIFDTFIINNIIYMLLELLFNAVSSPHNTLTPPQTYDGIIKQHGYNFVVLNGYMLCL